MLPSKDSSPKNSVRKSCFRGKMGGGISGVRSPTSLLTRFPLASPRPSCLPTSGTRRRPDSPRGEGCRGGRAACRCLKPAPHICAHRSAAAAGHGPVWISLGPSFSPHPCAPPTHTHTADRSLGRRSLVLSFFYLNVLARPWPKGHTASGRPRPSRGSRSAGPIGRRPPGWAPAGRAGARQRLLRARGHPHPPLSWCPPRRPSSLRSRKGHLAVTPWPCHCAAPWGSALSPSWRAEAPGDP